MTSEITDEARDHLFVRRHNLLNKLGVTQRYHRKRQRFFDLVDKCTKAFTAFFGASPLLITWFREHWPLAGGLVTTLSLLNLVFGYSDKKQIHSAAADATLQLQARIEEIDFSVLTRDQTAKFEGEFSRLNGKEPPSLRTLVTICEWEQAVAEGQPEHIQLPNWLRRFFADFIS